MLHAPAEYGNRRQLIACCRCSDAILRHMNGQVLRTAVDGPGVVVATIDNPPLQLLDGPFFLELLALLDRLDANPGVRAVVWESADPDFFLMHGDVEMMVGIPPEIRSAPDSPNIAAAAFERLRRARYISIGALDGAARGGGAELLTAMDLRYGSPRALIGWPEVPVGILPGAGTTARLPALLGRARTLEVLLTARDIRAAEAISLGWLQGIVELDELPGHVRSVARRIAAMPPASVAAVKKVVDLALSDPDAALLAESRAVDALMAAGAHTAPMTAFLAAGGQTRAEEADPDRFAQVVDAVLDLPGDPGAERTTVREPG